MEPQWNGYCNIETEYKCGKNKNCYGIVAIVLLTAFAFVIGLIVGAAISEAILGALAAIIVLAVVLGLLLVLAVVLAICNKKDKLL